jgi:hypothetical protein
MTSPALLQQKANRVDPSESREDAGFVCVSGPWTIVVDYHRAETYLYSYD